MKLRRLRSTSFAVMALAVAITVNQVAQAGPPLICHPFEIGNAKSLPWAGSEWRAVKSDYDINRLVDDTLALLTPETPVIARMETLRRAVVYAVWAQRDGEVRLAAKNGKVAGQLLDRLMGRLKQSATGGKPNTLAMFDAGYFIESWRQATDARSAPQIDGYGMIVKATNMRGGDASMEFASALITSMRSDKATNRAHLQKAVAGAPEGSLLAKNIVKHYSDKGRNIAELRASVGLAKN
ncbi:MAG: hypothetical protein AB7U82_15185 [Blastocatellales bacterium]